MSFFKKYLPIFALLLAILFFSLNKFQQSSKNNSAPVVSWHELRKDKLQSLQVSNYKNTNENYTLTREQGEWKLTQPYLANTRQEYSILIVNGFLNFSVLQKLTNLSAEEFSSYGLDNPQLRVEATLSDKKKIGFIMGKPALNETQFYIAEINNTNTAFIASINVITPFIQGISLIIDNKFLNENIDSVSGFELKNTSNTIISFTNINNAWLDQDQKNVSWAMRQFLLLFKGITFNSENFILNPSADILSQYKISSTTPYLHLWVDTQKKSYRLGSTNNNQEHAVYMPEKNILVFAQNSEILSFFTHPKQDFYIKE